MVDAGRTWHRTGIEEDADVGFEDGAEGVEEPPMGVYFFLVFFFEAEDDLDGDYTSFCSFDFQVGIDGDFVRGGMMISWKEVGERGESNVLCVVYS